MERARRHLQRDILERGELAEALGHRDHFDAERALGHGRRRAVRDLLGDLDCHAIASISAGEVATAPNTPPCILIILIAWSWLPLSVAPQQSSSSRHSKPRSLASRMVVWTQTSVVMPVSTTFSMPRSRSISSRSVAQNEPFPGLSMIGSPAAGARSGMMFQPASPRTRMRPHGPGSPMPAPMRRERQRLFSGRSARSGRWPSRVEDVKALLPHGGEQPLDRLDRRARERKIVAHLVDIAADAAEVGLHVDDDQRRVGGPQVAVVGPGIGIGFHVALGHGWSRLYLVMLSSAGAPTRVRFGEQVMIMISKVKM